MKKKPLKPHFIILLAGTLYYLFNFIYYMDISDNDIWSLKILLRMTSFYIVFAVLVIGHGVSGFGWESITHSKSNKEVSDSAAEKPA